MCKMGSSLGQLALTWINTMTVYTPTAEEGVFTPVVKISGLTTGITYATQLGWFTRIADLVFLNIHIHLSSKGNLSGDVTVEGFPFNLQQAMMQLVIRDAPININEQLLAVPDYPSDDDLSLYRILADRTLEQVENIHLSDGSFIYI